MTRALVVLDERYNHTCDHDRRRQARARCPDTVCTRVPAEIDPGQGSNVTTQEALYALAAHASSTLADARP